MTDGTAFFGRSHPLLNRFNDPLLLLYKLLNRVGHQPRSRAVHSLRHGIEARDCIGIQSYRGSFGWHVQRLHGSQLYSHYIQTLLSG